MMKKFIIFCAAAAASAVYCDNNIVKTLPVTAVGGNTAFEMQYPGYVQIGNVKTPQLVFTAADGRKSTVQVRNSKALQRLNPGRYTVNAIGVTVKKIGENSFYSMVGNYTSDEMATVTVNRRNGRYGMFLYNWKYLRKNILEPFTTMTLGSANSPEIAQWRAEGRLVFRNASVTVDPDEPRGMPTWIKRTQENGIDGIIPDEFVMPAGRKDPSDASLGYTRPGHGFSAKHLANIRSWHKQFPDKYFYAWLGIPWNGDCSGITPLYEAVTSSNNSAILWESYVSSTSRHELHRRYIERGKAFKAASGGSLHNYIMAPATYEYMDNDGAIDFKVHLDMQFHLVANDPVFANVRGYSMWAAYYTEPEILRWFAKLVQHYGVDGEKSMLSEKYGYKLYPGILKAHNWENDKDWLLSGNAVLIDKKSTVLKQGYLPYTSKNFLKISVNSETVSAASQILQNLTPGKLYMVKIRYCTPDNPEKSDIPVMITLDNAEIISDELRYLQDFTRRSPHVWNARKIVFRAGDKPVKLTIAGQKGTAPTTVLVDMVQAAPYFAE